MLTREVSRGINRKQLLGGAMFAHFTNFTILVGRVAVAISRLVNGI